MGNTQARKDIQKQIEDEYKALRKYIDQIYGDITIVQNRNTMQRFVHLERLVDQQLIKDFQKKINIFDEHDGILEIKKHYSRSVDMCSQSRIYHILVQYQEISIEKEIVRRSESQRYFSREQLLKIMYQMVSILITLRKMNRQGRLPLHNKLFVLTKGYEVKALDPLLMDNRQADKNMFELEISDDPNRKNIFISPEAIKLLLINQRSQAQHQHSLQSSQVWTIGICFLEILLFVDAGQIYDFSQKVIDTRKLRQMFGIIFRLYGQDIQKIILGMLQENPKQRSIFSNVQRSLVHLGGISLSSRKSSLSPSRKQSLSLASKAISRKSM